ncbi:MAG: hypothetical protein IBX68_04255 [Dehalococcoidia bacterium]|nr:hypothetical protein [Dehalococcoidia bacterium]
MIRRKLTRSKLLVLLRGIHSGAGADASLYVPPGTPDSDLEKLLRAGSISEEVLPEICSAIGRSRTGGVLFSRAASELLVLPPFEITERLFCSGLQSDPLISLMERDRVSGLILVRLGAYAVGVFSGEKLLSSKVGTGHIHARHRKGGSSQRRFERGRDKDIEQFFIRVCGHVRERLEPYIQQLEHLSYGGERYTVLAFRKQCDFVKAFDDRTRPALLNVREPRQATLEAAIAEVYSSEVLEWKLDEAAGNDGVTTIST